MIGRQFLPSHFLETSSHFLETKEVIFLPRNLQSLRGFASHLAQDFCAEVALEAKEEAKILQELHHPHIAARRRRAATSGWSQ